MFRQKAEDGHMQYIDILVDAESCMHLSGLTAHQKLVTDLRWRLGFTLKDCAQLLNCSIEAVRQSEAAAKVKMQRVLIGWSTES